MSLQTCQAGVTTGFPIRLAQSLYSDWPATPKAQNHLQKLVIPTDFTVQWGPPSPSSPIIVTHNTKVFQVTGFDTIADSTTLTYGNATYSCSQVLSITKNQHANFTQSGSETALYEAILAFQINNKSENPSSPDIILMCRPIVFSNWNSSPFWVAVNKAALKNTPQSTAVDLSQLYGYSKDLLMPMITYQTCLPVKLLNYKGSVSTYGSISVRVHVVAQPIYMMADDNGMGKCSNVPNYVLTTRPKRPANIFDGAAWNTIFQFRDGLGDDLFPVSSSDNMVSLPSPTAISAFEDIIHTVEFLVPEAFIGKTISEITTAEAASAVAKKKKAYKCYVIDPKKDIVNDQILVDPTTGQTLSDTMKQESIEEAGGDPSLLNVGDPGSSGLMPGDIQQIIFIIVTTISSIILVAYLGYIAKLFINDKDHKSGITNLFIFILLLVLLILFGVFVGEDK